ncbi:MAG: hypothetical protein ACRDK2_09065 [Solirubrobacteraceae bacterium]
MALALVPAAASAASGGPGGPRASTATVKTCPAGQSLQGNYCEPLKCPAGQSAEGNYCEPIKCPAGQVLQGNTCQNNGGGGPPPPPPPPCTVNAPQSAAVAAQAALTAVTGAGVSGLASSGRVSFSFVSQTCGGYRFLLRVRDPRRGHGHHTVTIGYTTVINYLSTILQGKTKTVNVTIKKVGKSILSYAKAHKLSLRMLVITHVRASNSQTSVQVLDGILLK